MRADGSLRLAVVADTHSRPHPKAAELVAGLRPDGILHAGDIGDLAVLETLAGIAPLFAIRGNIDGRAPGLADQHLLDIVPPGPDKGLLLRLLLVHIAVSGPRLHGDVARLARAEGAGLVVCGHSHVPFIGKDAGLLVFNPGSVGPRRFHLPIVFGVLELTPAGLRLSHVDCETGKPWTPP